MWIRCPLCQFKYRDVTAAGTPAKHACAVTEFVIVRRAGALIDLPYFMMEPTDELIARGALAVADTDGQLHTQKLKRSLADVPPAPRTRTRASRPRAPRSKAAPRPGAH